MSEKLCTLRTKGGGGGKYTETSLWTNSAPTNSFSAQDITLSEGMSDFKYLKIRCAISTSSSTGIFEDIVLVTELSNTSSATVNNTRDRLVLGLGRDTYDYERAYYYVSNTSIHFNPAYQSGTSTTTATKIVPLEILGLNELDHGEVLSVSNPMICTPFRNTAPSGGTLTFTEAGTYLLVYFNQTTTTTETPTAVSGSMTIKRTLSAVTSANAYSSISGNMRAVTFEIEVTANTEIRGSVSSSNTMAYAIKLN